MITMKVKGEPIPPRRGFYYPDITKPEAVEASESAIEREKKTLKCC